MRSYSGKIIVLLLLKNALWNVVEASDEKIYAGGSSKSSLPSIDLTNSNKTKLKLPGIDIDIGIDNGDNNKDKNKKGFDEVLNEKLTTLSKTFLEQVEDPDAWQSQEICWFDDINCTGLFFNITLADPEDCSKFFLCIGKKLYHRTCPLNWKYNYILTLCLPNVLPNQCQKKCSDFPKGDDRYKTLIVDETSTSKPEMTSILPTSKLTTDSRISVNMGTSPHVTSKASTETSPLTTVPLSSAVKRSSTAVERSSTAVERSSTAVERSSTAVERSSTAVERSSTAGTSVDKSTVTSALVTSQVVEEITSLSSMLSHSSVEPTAVKETTTPEPVTPPVTREDTSPRDLVTTSSVSPPTILTSDATGSTRGGRPATPRSTELGGSTSDSGETSTETSSSNVGTEQSTNPIITTAKDHLPVTTSDVMETSISSHSETKSDAFTSLTVSSGDIVTDEGRSASLTQTIPTVSVTSDSGYEITSEHQVSATGLSSQLTTSSPSLQSTEIIGEITSALTSSVDLSTSQVEISSIVNHSPQTISTDTLTNGGSLASSTADEITIEYSSFISDETSIVSSGSTVDIQDTATIPSGQSTENWQQSSTIEDQQSMTSSGRMTFDLSSKDSAVDQMTSTAAGGVSFVTFDRSMSSQEDGLCRLPFPCSLHDVTADPENCYQYYVCVQYQEESTTRWLSQDCPIGLRFYQSLRNCSTPTPGEECTYNCRTEVIHNMILNPVGPIQGYRQEVLCTFQVEFSLRQIRLDHFSWYKNNVLISPGTSRDSRIQTKLSGPDWTGVWNISLLFNPLEPQDSGLIRCDIVYGGKFSSTISRSLSVLLLPKVQLQPSRLTVYDGEIVTFTCSADLPNTPDSLPGSASSTPGEFSVDFEWFINGLILTPNTSDYEIHKDLNSTTSTLRLTADSQTTVMCALVVTSLSSKSYSDVSELYVIDRSSKPHAGRVTRACDPEETGGLDWPLTAAGSIGIQLCSPPLIGKIKRICNDAGMWMAATFSDCLTADMKDILAKISELEDGIGVEDGAVMTNITSLLRNHVTSSKSLTNNASGDFNASVESLRRLTDLRKTFKRPQASEVSNVLWTVSSLVDMLDQRQQRNINMSDTDNAVTLMQTVEIYAQLWARNLSVGQQDSFVSDSLVVQVSANRRSELDIVSYPRQESSSDWFNNNDRITLYQDYNTSDILHDGDVEEIQYVSSAYFSTLHKFMPQNGLLNSRIISLSVDDISSEGNLVTISLDSVKNFSQEYEPNCVFWDYSIGTRGDWSDRGCRVVNDSANESHVTCECDHLTNFAILMSPSPQTEGHHAAILSIISMIGCIISIISLFMTVALFVLRWSKVKSHQAVVIINLCIALIVGNIIFLAGVDKTASEFGCKLVAALLHFFFLAAFFLMLVEGILLLLYVIFVFHHRRKRETALLITAAWFIPLVIVGISLGATQTVGYGASEDSKQCWLSVKRGVFWAFVVPALVIICTNVIILVLVLHRIIKAKRRVMPDERFERIRNTLWNVAALTPVLGIMWIFGVLSLNKSLLAFQYIFAISNSFQGLFIFIFHGLCNQRNNKSRYEVKSAKKKNSSKRSSKKSSDQQQQGRLDRSDIVVIISPSIANSSSTDVDHHQNFTFADEGSSVNSYSSQEDSDFHSMDTGTTEFNSDSRQAVSRKQKSSSKL